MISKDMKKKEAIEFIELLDTIEEINAFTEGDDRNDVIASAQIRQQELEEAGKMKKQGEQPGPITHETHDFKGSGIEGTKDAAVIPQSAIRNPKLHITGSDIVEAIDKTDEKKSLEFERQAAEEKAAADKAKQDAAVPRSYVTGEDVIKKMRAEGQKI